MNIKSLITITSLLFFSQGCSTTTTAATSVSSEHEILLINITYKNQRENDAKALTKVLREKGYIVNIRASTTTPPKISQSYMYIDKSNYKAGIILSKIIREELNEEVSVNFSKSIISPQEARIALLNPKA